MKITNNNSTLPRLRGWFVLATLASSVTVSSSFVAAETNSLPQQEIPVSGSVDALVAINAASDQQDLNDTGGFSLDALVRLAEKNESPSKTPEPQSTQALTTNDSVAARPVNTLTVSSAPALPLPQTSSSNTISVVEQPSSTSKTVASSQLSESSEPSAEAKSRYVDSLVPTSNPSSTETQSSMVRSDSKLFTNQPVVPVAITSQPTPVANKLNTAVNTTIEAPTANSQAPTLNRQPIASTLNNASTERRAAIAELASTLPTTSSRNSSTAQAAITDNSARAANGLSEAKIQQQYKRLSNEPVWQFLHNTVNQALHHSSEVQQAATNILVAEEEISAAQGQRYPQMNVEAASQTWRVGQSNKDRIDSNLQLKIVTPIYDWGRISSQVDERSYAKTSNEMQLQLKRDEIAYNAVAYSLELARNRELLKVTDDYVKRMSDLVQLLSEIVKVDPGRGSELYQAETKKLQAITARDALVAKMRDLEIAIERVVGKPLRIPDNLRWDGNQFDSIDEQALLEKHPIMLQATAEYERSMASAKALQASHLPQVNLNVARALPKFAYDSKEDDWLVGVNVSWAAFQGGSASASERAAIQQAQTVLYQKETIYRDLQNRIASAKMQRQNALSRSVEYTNLVDASKHVKEMFYDQWFHLGKKQLLDVLSAESDFYANQQMLLNLKFDSFLFGLKTYTEAGFLLTWLDIQNKS